MMRLWIARRRLVQQIALATAAAALLLTVSCRAPVGPAATEAPTALSTAAVPTASPATETRPPRAATPSPAWPGTVVFPPPILIELPGTATSASPVTAIFGADTTELEAGGCCWLHWRVADAREVTLDGAPVGASGQRQVCPTETTVYRLGWRDPTGAAMSRAVTVTVRSPALTLAVVPPRFEEPKKPKERPAATGVVETPTECTPCAGATRRPTATRPPPPTEAPEPSPTAAEPTPEATAAPPTATAAQATPEEPTPAPTVGA